MTPLEEAVHQMLAILDAPGLKPEDLRAQVAGRGERSGCLTQRIMRDDDPYWWDKKSDAACQVAILNDMHVSGAIDLATLRSKIEGLLHAR